MSDRFPTLEWIEKVAEALSSLDQEFVFVGGATLPFYLRKSVWNQARPTKDVDVVLELLTFKDVRRFEDELLSIGFENDTRKGAPKCRFIYKEIAVDILSTDREAQGFKSKWYQDGFKHAKVAPDASSPKIKIFTLPYFLASKIDAFHDRGKSDFLASKDLEDIVSIFDANPESDLEKEVSQAPADVKIYLKENLANLLDDYRFADAVPGAVFSRQLANEASEKVLNRVRSLVSQL